MTSIQVSEHWTKFLTKYNASIDQRGVHHFSTTGSDSSQALPTLMALTHLACAWIDGPDTRKFLQGQITCDVEKILAATDSQTGHSLLGAHCNTKGRMVFSFRAITGTQGNDSIGMIMDKDLIATAEPSLKKYMVFSKAQLHEDQDYVLLGLMGDDALTLLADKLGISISLIEGKVNDVHKLNTGQLHDGQLIVVSDNRFLLQLTLDAAQSLWTELAPHCRLAGYPQWELADIRDGYGFVHRETSEEFIPQQLNYHLNSGVSFTKGCYIGQEVVARTQYRGNLKRHMRRAAVKTATLPIPGAPLFVPNSPQSVGQVVTVVSIEPDTVEMLVVVTDSAFDNDAAYLDTESSQKLSFLPLPYAINK